MGAPGDHSSHATSPDPRSPPDLYPVQAPGSPTLATTRLHSGTHENVGTYGSERARHPHLFESVVKPATPVTTAVPTVDVYGPQDETTTPCLSFVSVSWR